MKRILVLAVLTVALTALVVAQTLPIAPITRPMAIGKSTTITMSDTTSLTSTSAASGTFYVAFPIPMSKSSSLGEMSMYMTTTDTMKLSVYALPARATAFGSDLRTVTLSAANAIYNSGSSADTLWLAKRITINGAKTVFGGLFVGSGLPVKWGPCDGLKINWAIATASGAAAPSDSGITFRPYAQ